MFALPPIPVAHLASIAFANEAWGWTALFLGFGAMLVLALGYWRSPLRGAAKWTALTLKAIGLILLALVLMEPVHLSEEPRKNANDLAVAVDNSAGLTVAISNGEPAPAEVLRGAVTTDDPFVFPSWLETLGDTFRLQTFLFDRGLRRTTDFSDLDFRESGTRLAGTFEGLSKRFENRPLAATILLTDGNATDEEQLQRWLERIESGEVETAPVYPVVPGEDNPDAFDLALGEIDAKTTDFEDARVTLEVEARARGKLAAPVEVFARNDQGEELAVETVVFPPESGHHLLPVRLRIGALPPGVSFLTVGIRQVAEEPSHELTERNNERRVVVHPGAGPYRILYVSGRPNWEYKFLRRAIAGDAEIDLAGLIRIAKREPKFEWRGREGESSNPLFRGFQRDVPEDIHRYDEPVFVRLNTASSEELRDGFPRTEEDLFPRFRAVILDDVEAEFLTLEQQELLDRFVSRRGGTVIMLGGQESFHAGNWENTPVARLLPVYLENFGNAAPAVEASFNLTREGLLEPWLRHRTGQEDERIRLAYMPPFYAVNPIRAIKPGASILATVTDSENRVLPAIVTHRYGEGKSAALAIGDFWRWGMKDSEQREELEKFWRQLMRWSVTDVPTRVSMEAEDIESGGPPLTRFSVRVRDPLFDPQDDATVMLTVTDEEGTVTRLAGEPSLEEPGLFTADFASANLMGFRVDATVIDGGGEEVGTAQLGRALNPDAEEFARLGPNTDLLERIAKATGGEMLALHQVGELPSLLKNLNLPVSEVKQRPLWHAPWLFLLALLFFLGEWIIRRRRGIL